MSWLKWKILDPNIYDTIVYLPCGVTHSLKDRSYYSDIVKNSGSRPWTGERSP